MTYDWTDDDVAAEREAQAFLDRQSRPKRGNPERSQQIAVVRYLRTVLPQGSIVASVKNEEKPYSDSPTARMNFAMKRRVSGMLPGFPDLIVLAPPGRCLLIEMKAPKSGRLSEAQKDLHPRLRAAGIPVGVCTDIDSARAFMLANGIQLRESVF